MIKPLNSHNLSEGQKDAFGGYTARKDIQTLLHTLLRSPPLRTKISAFLDAEGSKMSPSQGMALSQRQLSHLSLYPTLEVTHIERYIWHTKPGPLMSIWKNSELLFQLWSALWDKLGVLFQFYGNSTFFSLQSCIFHSFKTMVSKSTPQENLAGISPYQNLYLRESHLRHQSPYPTYAALV